MLTERERRSIINWPEQHYENGVGKNTNTARRYKRAVRILKTLRNEMAYAGISEANPIPSFLIECLVWNAPDNAFDCTSYWAMIRAVLAELYKSTLQEAHCTEWGEVSELKYLFQSTQPWTPSVAHEFLSAAWDYIGYK